MYRFDGQRTFKDRKPTSINSRKTQSNNYAENTYGANLAMTSQAPAYAFC